MRRFGAPIASPSAAQRHDQNAGNESSGQDFRSMRPSLAVNYTAHVADSQRFLLQGPLFSKEALAQIAKSGGLRFRSELPAVLASGAARGGRQCWRFLTRTRLRYAQPHRHRFQTQPSNRSRDRRETTRVPARRAGTPGAPKSANQPAPRTGRAVAIDHSLGQTSLLSRLGRHGRPMGAQCHQ